ncbi:MAG: BamA/TamA family outer membrane protein, partial [Rhizobiales bacterium]|nr:BamA/TamA family outer membrane protein [Hyphomicrobiales bacterium]
FGMKAAVFADAGSLWGYRGIQSYGGQTITAFDNNAIRSSVGVGLIWDSPFGPLRFDYAYPITDAGTDALGQKIDRIQQFRFSGGTRF